MSRQSTLIDKDDAPETALAPVSEPASSLVLMFERLAKDPAVDVEKLERLIAMQERILARNAESAFNVAFTALQASLPEIEEHGGIKDRAGEVQSRYAKWEDIKKVITPILGQHGFSLRHKVEWPSEKSVKVTAFLTHADGHFITSEFLSGADSSGNKNAIQALGSSTQYGRRYTAIDVTGITSREPSRRDDDGQTSEAYKQPTEPDGLSALLTDLEAKAADSKTFYATWNKAPQALRQYVTKYRKHRWDELKALASGGAA